MTDLTWNESLIGASFSRNHVLVVDFLLATHTWICAMGNESSHWKWGYGWHGPYVGGVVQWTWERKVIA